MRLKVLGPDINESAYKFNVNDKGEIRFGLGAIKGEGEGAKTIVNDEKKTDISIVFLRYQTCRFTFSK